MASLGKTPRVTPPRLAQGDVRVRIGAVGVSALGTQVAGTIDAVGPESAGFARNDRVGFRSTAQAGSLMVVIDERDLIGIPSGVSLDAAAALFPCALLARTIVKQVHAVGRGNRVSVTDVSVVAPFIAAWAEHLGASIVAEDADVVISGQSVRAGLAVRAGHGLAQQSAADVFAALRAGAFDRIALSTPAEARDGSRSPVLLHPAEVSLAA